MKIEPRTLMLWLVSVDGVTRKLKVVQPLAQETPVIEQDKVTTLRSPSALASSLVT